MKKCLCFVALATCVFGASIVGAQEHVFTAGSASAATGSQAAISVTYDNNNAGPEITQGFNYGLCTADETVAIATAHVAGADGAGAFTAYNVVAGGVTAGVILSFDAMVVLGPGTVGAELSIATYDILAEGTTALDFCDTLGSPAVPIGVGLTDTSLPNPPVAIVSGSVSGLSAPPPFIYTAPTLNLDYDGDTGMGSFTANFTIGENPGNALGSPTSGFTMAVQNDPAVLQATLVDDAPLTAALGGTPAAFVGPNILPGNTGWTIGVIYDFGQVDSPDLTAGPVVMVAVDYNITAPLAPTPDTVTPLTFTTLGTPAVINEVTIGSLGQMLVLNDGVITLTASVAPEFVRGDCNSDSTINIADGITVLNTLFQGGTLATCLAACDTNADDLFDASDAIYIFNYQFLDGPPPSAPFPDCGPAPDERGDCEVQVCP